MQQTKLRCHGERGLGGQRLVLLLAVSVMILGSRRPWGCNGESGPDRLLRVESATGELSSNLARTARTRTVSEIEIGYEGGTSPFERVHWRGDASSFVDVFDVPILAPPPAEGSEAENGARFGNVVRVPYPRAPNDDHVLQLSPEDEFTRLSARFDASSWIPPWRGSRALRMYDRGECSGSISWRELAQALADGMDAVLWEGDGATPNGNWVLTYTIHDEFRGDRDRFTFTRPYRGRVPGTEIWVYRRVRITGRFTVSDQTVRYYGIESVKVAPDGGEERFTREQNDALRTAIASGLRRAIARPVPIPLPCALGEGGDADCFSTVPGLIELGYGVPASEILGRNVTCAASEGGGTAGNCAFVPNVYRVNHRVDGVELVLSEYSPEAGDADPFFPLLEEARVCHGLLARWSQPQACVHDAIFEIPPVNRRGIRFCGDALLTP